MRVARVTEGVGCGVTAPRQAMAVAGFADAQRAWEERLQRTTIAGLTDEVVRTAPPAVPRRSAAWLQAHA
jgi:hypothetical protein